MTSGRIEGSIEVSGLDAEATGLSEAVIVFATAFDSNTGDHSFLMDMSSMMSAIETDDSDPLADVAADMFDEMEVRQIGDVAYVRFPFLTSMFGAETEWVSMPAEEGETFTSDFGAFPTDPTDVIGAFEEAGATVETLGPVTVNGVEATHYRVSLDTDSMDLSTAEKAELAESGLFANGTIPMELWVSGDGYVVRMIMEIDGTGMDLSPEERFDRMTLRYDVFDIDGDIVIEPPPATEVTPMDDLEGAGFGFDQ